jgi:hypothetical protein
MAPEVILHIGMHKTGTTSIQSALKNFDDGRVRYAQLNDVNHSIPIFSLFSKDKYEYQIHKNFGRSPDEIDTINDNTVIDLERELNMDREKIIICGEDISALKPDEVQSLLAWLKARTESIKVVAYVRDPVGFASSVLQQCIYGGMRKTCIPTPDYRNRFEAYSQCVDVDSIEFVEFKKTELVHGSVVADFCSRIGLDSSGLKEHRVNESMSLECTQLLYHFNRFGILASGNSALVKARNEFIYFLSQHFTGDSFKIPKDWVWAHMRMNDISWMEQVSGIQLAPSHLNPEDASESKALDVLEETMAHIDVTTLHKLQELVSKLDESVSCDTDVTNLLNFLFASFYFKETYARENAEALALDGNRREKIVDEHRQHQAKQDAALAQSTRQIEIARMANEELRKRENEAKVNLLALQQRGFMARLLNKPSQSGKPQ